MITEQIILSLYAIILMEIGLLLLVLLIMVLDIKKSIDAVRNLIDKALHLGDLAVNTAEELKSNLVSVSGITTAIGNISKIVSSWKNSSKSQGTDESDDLGAALIKVFPKKKKRII
jgi:hypothetical protein